MITISLCMIVRDEEDVLARCLDSVREAVDEIIIVDTGSQDLTKEIAGRYTDKIYDFKWCDDFSAARNYAFSKGGMDYLMWLDADDILPEPSLRALMDLKERLEPQVSVVMMPYHVSFDERGRPCFVYERERLIKNNAGFCWKGVVHEAITPMGTILHSDVVIEHRKLKQGDPDRNLRIYEKQLASGTEMGPRESFYYARELFYHGRYKEAIDEFTYFLTLPDSWLENRLDACRMIAACYDVTDRPDAALKALLASLSEDEPRAEICCDIGRHFMERKEYRTAAFWYETAASRKASIQNGAFVNRDCYDYIPYMQLCVCYYWLGDIQQAKKNHRLAAETKPEDAAVKYNEIVMASL